MCGVSAWLHRHEQFADTKLNPVATYNRLTRVRLHTTIQIRYQQRTSQQASCIDTLEISRYRPKEIQRVVQPPLKSHKATSGLVTLLLVWFSTLSTLHH